jgi:hypothetical protein
MDPSFLRFSPASNLGVRPRNSDLIGIAGLSSGTHSRDPLAQPILRAVICVLIRAQETHGMSKTRIMYIENKSTSLNGPARIGRVTFSKTGKSISYRGRTFQSLKGSSYKANYFDVETGERFWISGARKDGNDRLYPQSTQPVEIDDDVTEEYWRDVRGKQPIDRLAGGNG